MRARLTGRCWRTCLASRHRRVRQVTPTPTRSGNLRKDLEGLLKTLEQDRVHGPYWLRCITPDRFEAIDLVGLRDKLNAWGLIDGGGISAKGLDVACQAYGTTVLPLARDRFGRP